jgi:hypothetical protein
MVDFSKHLRRTEMETAIAKRDEAALTVGSPAMPEQRTISAEEDRSIAVSKLLAKAYEKASELVLTKEETKALKAKFDDDCVRAGAGGDSRLLYISHIHVSDRLNDVLGIGQWALVKRSIRLECGKTAKGVEVVSIYFEGVMLIRGSFVAEAIGTAEYYPSNPKMDYGSAIESAMSDCLSRCGKRLSIGSQVWDKTYCEKWLKTHESIVDEEDKAKREAARERLEEMKRNGQVRSAYTGATVKPGETVEPPKEPPAPDDTSLIDPRLSALMEKAGITRAQLKAWYTGGNPKGKCFGTWEPEDLPGDFVTIITSDGKWPRVSQEMLGNK